MASRLAWLDYSDHERRKALEVIDLFHEEETRDELGIGSIRDSFADQLFPGTSTIQTRARYFFFIPWIYLELESHRNPHHEVALRLRRHEVRLMDELAESEDTRGVIGKQSRDSLKRLPSSVYWSGLGTWGIRKFRGSQEDYHRILGSVHEFERRRSRRDDGELLDDLGRENWHSNLPAAPDEFPSEAIFELTQYEADYLTDRVRSHATGTMIATLLDRGNSTDCGYPWEHPQLRECPETVQTQVSHADNFSLSMHGAALLYNLMLAEKSNWEARVEAYHDALIEWWDSLNDQNAQLSQWDREIFWKVAGDGNTRIPNRTRRFVDAWLDAVFAMNNFQDIVESKELRAMISEREYTLKHARARLHNPRALENWRGKAGTARIDFRWKSAQDIINDVLWAKGR